MAIDLRNSDSITHSARNLAGSRGVGNTRVAEKNGGARFAQIGRQIQRISAVAN